MRTFAGRDWYYDFTELPQTFSDADCGKVAATLFRRYAALTKSWSVELNSEWICRLFMSAKLIMSSTLHVNAAHYAEERNLRVVIPYLRYYSVLSLLRAICYTLPEHEWRNGRLIQISHAAAIHGAIEHIGQFDRAVATAARSQIRELKAERELISYRAPSSGDDQIADKNRFLALCTLLAETAQFNSEIFECSVLKHANPAHFQLLSEHAREIASIEIDGHYFSDPEDASRLRRLADKQNPPGNLRDFMKEGHVDEFFGAWVADRDDEGLFDPDDMVRIIFDIP